MMLDNTTGDDLDRGLSALSQRAQAAAAARGIGGPQDLLRLGPLGAAARLDLPILAQLTWSGWLRVVREWKQREDAAAGQPQRGASEGGRYK